MSKQIGLTDVPAYGDLFEIESYVDGLTNFIRECKTPMTISIQGTWGTGKTSVMNMIEKKLSNNTETYHCVSFNTWEFSQFNMEGDLPLVMIQSLIESLSGKNKSLSDTIGNVVNSIASIAAGYFSGGAVKINVKELFEKGYLQQIRTLKNEFQILINKKAGLVDPDFKLGKNAEKDNIALNAQSGNKRIIFFIDDLDRLDPEKAVELLEVLKNFLDCRNCVFILAIDYDVVWRGVAAKYGHVIGDKPKDIRKKGKDFFDKIIQVPFKMPVASYQVGNYIDNCLKEINVSVSNTDINTYHELVKRSVGTNPRNLKRIINSFALLIKVIGDEQLNKINGHKLLFASLCMQHSFEKVYNYLVRNYKELDFDQLICLTTGTCDDVTKKMVELNITKDELDDVQPFMQVLLKNALDLDIDGQTEDKISRFKEIFKMSAITAGASEEPERKRTSDKVKKDSMKHIKFTYDQVEHIFSIVNKSLEGKNDYLVNYINTKGYGHAAYKYKGKTFFDVIFYDEDKGYAEIGCIPRDVSLWNDTELSMICEKREIMKGISYFNSKGVSFKYRFNQDDPMQDTDLLKIATACVNDVFSINQ